MNWLSRLLGKPKTDRPQPEAPTPFAEPAPDLGAPASISIIEPPAKRAPPAPLSQTADPAEDFAFGVEEDEVEEPDVADDEDPTIGRYEPLEEQALDADELTILRADAEKLALSGSHRIGPSDPAGPGSLVETLMRLEEEGRMVSRVGDDAENGFYILYEPISL